jgi:hypothetical protein
MTERTTTTAFHAAALAEYNTADLTKAQLRALAAKLNVFLPAVVWKNRVGKGLFRIPNPTAQAAPAETQDAFKVSEVKIKSGTAKAKTEVTKQPARKAAVQHAPTV